MADPGSDSSASFDYDCVVIAISANPGVNPSLTITAISERAMSRVPPRDAQRA